MNEPTRTQWQIRCAFNGFCKQALKNEAINAHKRTKWQQLREVTFSDLTPQEENQLYTYVSYFADDEVEQSFSVAGKKIIAKLLAVCLERGIGQNQCKCGVVVGAHNTITVRG